MTGTAAAEPTVTTFTSTVDSIDSTAVVLTETYFYAEGGGQPADRGTLGGVEVIDVQHRNGDIVHELAEPPSFDTGETVEGQIDTAFRTYCMRAHTASHVLYGAGRRLLSDLGYGGFDISATLPDAAGDGDFGPAITGKVRVDFDTTTEIDDETLTELERLTNRAVWESYDVSWDEIPRDEALDRDDIAFNTKTEEGIKGETVRVVTIEDWDVAACGGTHVGNTREIGPVTVLSRSNPGEGLTRVEFAVGPRAIRQRATEHERAMTAAQSLDTNVAELPAAVDGLQSEHNDLRETVSSLRERLVDSRLDDLRDDAIEADGRTWLVGTVTGLDANGLADRAERTVGDDTDVAALVDADGQYLGVATNGGVDASEVVERVTTEFGGGGGGRPTVAQGGGLSADGADIVTFLRNVPEA
ncbi:alanyl-tRNA synthetase [Haloarcula vallismortis]|uniref:Alanyl-tRNA synthetase n=2 Tax=Haloarcula vallismortis TaxID=28442 RepID=M0JQ76_HALVA|nr:DHHA1 domain-containing protein [Haloarcula vallismortis]EMA10129.1 alanyl-tRNA synthetase [Haloarcula vallismortis ATCC 29715]SDW95241.1 alanyl-tRNA synthetase [Haloarcula vallismortis]